jgi:hypothetical protein
MIACLTSTRPAPLQNIILEEVVPMARELVENMQTPRKLCDTCVRALDAINSLLLENSGVGFQGSQIMTESLRLALRQRYRVIDKGIYIHFESESDFKLIKNRFSTRATVGRYSPCLDRVVWVDACLAGCSVLLVGGVRQGQFRRNREDEWLLTIWWVARSLYQGYFGIKILGMLEY